eukprot:jgi/Botrbrau1/10078/Bobra.0355s0031.1
MSATQTLPGAVEEEKLTQQEISYTACYCEENAYLLSKELVQDHPNSRIFCVFVSNQDRRVAFWNHRSGQRNRPLLWDYHVIVLEAFHDLRPALVWDLDVSEEVPFPCRLGEYAAKVLRCGQHDLDPLYFPGCLGEQRMYRVVPATVFLRHFASDRSHMLDVNGTWVASPPPYPCIQAKDGTTNNLQRYIDMAHPPANDDLSELLPGQQPEPLKYGTVMDEPTFLNAFTVTSQQHPYSARSDSS